MTVAAWIKPTVVNDWKQASVVTKFEADKYQWKIGLTVTDNLRFDVFESQTGTVYPVGGSITAGIFSHIVGTFNGQAVKIYLNGVYLTELSFGASTTIQNVVTSLQIGYEPANGRYFDGIIDEVRIYNRALNDKEIWDLYQRGL
jgi:hypothetical protein